MRWYLRAAILLWLAVVAVTLLKDSFAHAQIFGGMFPGNTGMTPTATATASGTPTATPTPATPTPTITATRTPTATPTGVVWSITQNSNNFTFNAPALYTGPAAPCKFYAVATELGAGNSAAVIGTKYGTNAAWASAMNQRLQGQFGTNAMIGSEGFDYSNNYPANGIPFVAIDQIGHRALANRQASYGIAGNVKDVYSTNSPNIVCNGPGGTASTPDSWDSGSTCTTTNCENALNFYGSCLLSASCSILQQNVHPPAQVEYQMEEVDNYYGFNKLSHYDMGYFLLSQQPSYSTNAGVPAGPPVHTYVDHTFYAKERARDILLNEYYCTGAGTPAAGCTGAGTGTYSADPSGGPFGGTYVGAPGASAALALLNTAWGLTGSIPCTTSPSHACNSPYTGWNTDSSGGLADLATGNYLTGCGGANCHGVETQFLGENGKRIGPASGSCFQLSGGAFAWGRNATVVSDSHLVVADQVTKYTSNAENALPGAHPPFGWVAYNPPSWVLTAAAAGLSADTNSLFWLSPGASVGDASGIFSSTNATSTWQALINAIDNGVVGGKAIHAAEFWTGNSKTATDSPIPTFDCVGFGLDNLCFGVQATRGATMVTYWNLLRTLTSASGRDPFTIFEHLYEYDNPAQTQAFGLSTPNDNPYDGAASTTTSNATAQTACAISTVYNSGTICKDANGNYEGFYGRFGTGATCTTGGSLPTWNTQNGGLTQSGTSGTDSGGVNCIWVNEGLASQQRLPEVANYATANPGGGSVIPLQNWLAAGICDGAPIATPTPTATATATPTVTATPTPTITATPTATPTPTGGTPTPTASPTATPTATPTASASNDTTTEF